MQTEIEVKFINVDFDSIRTKLTQLGAVCTQPMRLMRRAIIETPQLEAKNGFVRIRDEGDKTTLTYKQFDDTSLTGAREVEVVVSDFAACMQLLDQAGLPHKSFQESRRETWKLGSVEVVLDEWPHLNPYIEIEGNTEQAVKEVAAVLGFHWNDAVFGRVTEVYQRQYPNGEGDKLVTVPELTFDKPLPKIISGQ